MKPIDIATMIDFTAVTACATKTDVAELVSLAKQYHFKCIGTMPCFIPYARELLGEDEYTILGGCAGFPSGDDKTEIKVLQAKDMLADGCKEMDMVINIAYMKSGLYQEVLDDVCAVKRTVGDIPLKVILEVTYLNEDEIKRGCEIVAKAGAEFIKTGTGWAPEPTTIDHIKLIRSQVGDSLQIKAAGGIRDLDTLLRMRELGVTRFGIGKKSALKIMRTAQARYGNEL